ncbi:TerD family protein [Arthrobacter sp. AL08]|uniref:TerD family protein n=1 Tax=Micrococcaceae TaxID=1268 RepID=UPI001CFFC7B2|nr:MULTISPECIES: TerD family protein [Micrococcaceae]MCB5280748.1 General stress protein 16U [Arthrobacter sp. ES1]MDI3241053.1 TerD family protein [Arthrobacter sp. AL05]MDI3276971.1 TerD family protein [Arthrobacter sp. AL08]MDJ0352895.1 TerD family protein [Pseudarthrobacter sp. PH31-O2]WGZ79681.1 TerD family protein [Arthrobacter sp. EM1]
MGLSLKKGQSLSLTKQNGESLTNVRLGLGWDSAVPAKRGFFGGTKTVEIDLDASALMFDAAGTHLDTVFFNQLTSKDGAIRHTGDNLTGAGEGDDETLMVNLPGVSPAVAHIVFVITSYSQQTFNMVENAFCRVIDDSVAGSPEVARYALTESGPNTAMVMSKLSRNGSVWNFTAIGAPANGRTAGEVLGAAAAAL